MRTLPPGPYLRRLRLLSLDWEPLLRCHGVLLQQVGRAAAGQLPSAPAVAGLGVGAALPRLQQVGRPPCPQVARGSVGAELAHVPLE